VNWPNAFLVLLLGLYLFRAAGPSDHGLSDGGSPVGADSSSRAAAYVTGEVLDVPTHGEFTRLLSLHAADTGLPVVVDFYSQSCGPCRQIAPHYKALAKDMAGEAVFLKVDVNQNRLTASQAQVRAMPTFHFYQDDKLRHKFSGADGSRLEQVRKPRAQGQASLIEEGFV
jgi:thioredoxin 1